MMGRYEKIDGLLTTILQSHVFHMQVVGLTLGVSIGISHFLSPPILHRQQINSVNGVR